jgi:hypothetical protein
VILETIPEFVADDVRHPVLDRTRARRRVLLKVIE